MRIKNSLINIKYNILSLIILTIVSFVSRTIFVKILGESFLGINGLFTNIISVLSLADMGIGTVLVYSMYKPLAVDDKKQIKCYINVYKKIYNGIAFIVFLLGIILIPFLKYFIKDNMEVQHLTLIYLLYLLNTVVSYLCIYKISIINADQKNYIVTFRQQIFNLISNICMSIILILTHSFIFYLLIQILFSIASNIYLSIVAERMYPYIKNVKNCELDQESKNEIKKNTKAMIYHKVGGVVVSSTDNILISSMIGLKYVGLYSNYSLIIGMVNRFLSQIFSSLTASVGNLIVKEKNNYSYLIFNRILFLNFWLYSFSSIALICLLNCFITIWLGNSYNLSITIVFIISLNFYIDGLRKTVLIFKESYGLFWQDRYKPLLEGFLNLIFSIILAKFFGLFGIFFGTFLSFIFVSVPVEIHILFKYGFKISVAEYLKKMLKYIIIFIIALFVSFVLIQNLFNGTILNFVICCFIVVIVPNMIILLLTFKSDEFRYYYEQFIKKIFNIFKNKKNIE